MQVLLKHFFPQVCSSLLHGGLVLDPMSSLFVFFFSDGSEQPCVYKMSSESHVSYVHRINFEDALFR